MQKFDQNLEEIREYLKRRIGMVEQAKALGIEVIRAEERGVTSMLPYSDKIVGNPDTKIIHSGALTTFMDHTLGGSVGRALYPKTDVTPTIDLRVDHLKAAEPFKPIYGYGEVYRISSSVVFTKAIGYQDSIDDPICYATASFMRLDLGLDMTKPNPAVKEEAKS